MSNDPDAIRSRVRDSLYGLLSAEGAGVTLDDPHDWSTWDETPAAVTGAIRASCPLGGSTDVEAVAAWGGQLITSKARCRTCNTYSEALRQALALASR